MGLPISRSIAAAHAEPLRAKPNDEAGMTMPVALPAGTGDGR
jgi:hypothetical protein